MSDPTWFAITGAVTGVIGAVTGIAGAIMGYIAYKHSQAVKAQDMRLELGRQNIDLRQLVASLPTHLEYAKKSRTRIAAATGRHGSGQMTIWLAEWDTDFAKAQTMSNAAAELPVQYHAFTDNELEAKLVETHGAMGTAKELKTKYDAAIAEDDRRREELRQRATNDR